MRLGVFGGTFDPPHIAHQILASEASHQLSLDRVLWVLTATPPHKLNQNILPLLTRLDLLHAAVESNTCFEISRIDIDRQAPHYALDTVRLLRAAQPGAELVYLMGGDSLRDLPAWHRPQDFVASCDQIGVMRRPGAVFDLPSLENVLPGLTAKTAFIDVPLIEISASDIRRRIAGSRPFRYFLPDPVYRIIQDRALYK